MRGHNSTIIFIAINDETGHLISFSKDLVSHNMFLRVHVHENRKLEFGVYTINGAFKFAISFKNLITYPQLYTTTVPHQHLLLDILT